MKTDERRVTIVVNLFGGPGSGKTTCAWEIAAKLKKRGYVVEYVPEYAKELVWDGRDDLLDGSLANQKAVYDVQKHNVDRLIGKVDFIVTDSPAILSYVYVSEKRPDADAFRRQCVEDYNAYKTFAIFVERGEKFEQAGRIHSLEESRNIDTEIKRMMADNGLYLGTYRHSTIDTAITNMQKTHLRLSA